MKTIIAGLVAWLAKQFLPTDWIKRQLTTVITLLMNRFFELADKLAKSTTVTEIDDKAVDSLRSYVMAEGVIQHFVDYVWSMIFGAPAPAPIDPVNPPDVTPEPKGPGILGRLRRWIWGELKKV